MFKNRWFLVLLVACCFINLGAAAAVDSADVKTEQTLHIDIPVKIETAKVVFNIDRLVFSGDMPFSR